MTSRERRIPCGRSTTFEFPKFKRPQYEGPVHKPHHARAAETDQNQVPTENLGDLLGRVSENSTGGIDSLIGEFEQLRGRLRTDGERIQREIEEYKSLSEQVMELTKTISESVEKVRASVDRSTTVPQEEV